MSRKFDTLRFPITITKEEKEDIYSPYQRRGYLPFVDNVNIVLGGETSSNCLKFPQKNYFCFTCEF